MPIKSFTDLLVWQKAHILVLEIYKITEGFPNRENFVLTSQITRASISVTSNIAEGFSRNSKKEKVQFYYDLFQKSIVIKKMLNKLISSIKNS